MSTGGKLLKILPVPILIAAAVVLAFVMRGTGDESLTMELYFLNESATTIQAEKHEIKYDSEEELPELVLEALKRGASESKNIRVMDKNVGWGLNRDGDRLLVDFSQEFLSTDDSRNLLATYAVVKSLCQIDGISAVKVTVEGGEIIAPDNSHIGYMTDRDINLESDSHTGESRRLLLYFIDSKSGRFVPEYRTVKVTDNVPIEQYIITELIKGAEDSSHSAVLASDTQLLSVEFTDRTAFVNMGQNFIDRNSGSAEKEACAVWAIVNSITETGEIDSVQFLIDGKKTSGFSSVDLNEPLRRREDMIKTGDIT